jgi:hypothetical protein
VCRHTTTLHSFLDSFKISVSAESSEEAYKSCSGLSAGGNIEAPSDDIPPEFYFDMLETISVLNGWWILTQPITEQ